MTRMTSAMLSIRLVVPIRASKSMPSRAKIVASLTAVHLRRLGGTEEKSSLWGLL